ncbi:MAG: hypothetical protein ACP5HU_10560 [Phycisphaerae bacterium]
MTVSPARQGGLAVLLASVLLAVGCPAGRAYDRGTSLLESGHYDSAVAQLTEAVDKWPGILGENEDYLDTLERAREQGAAWHYQQARKDFSAARLDTAREHLTTALEYWPDLEGGNELLAEVDRRTEAATTMRLTAQALGEQGRWGEAVEQMRNALAQFQTLPGGRDELTSMERSAAEMHLADARRALERDDRETAEREARRALEYHQTSAAQDVLREVADRRKADELVAGAERMFASGQYRPAIENLREARRLHPRRTDIDPLIKRARVALCERLIAQADAHLSDNELVEAMRALVECDSVLTGFEGVADRMARIRPLLAERHLRRADTIDAYQRPAAALLEYLAAAAYGADDTHVQQAIQSCCGTIRENTAYTIALVGFDAYTGDDNLAAGFEADALEAMLRASPPNVTVVDARGGMASADAIISGSIIRSTVMQQQSSTLETTRYRAGTELVANPEFAEAVEDLQDARSDLIRAREDYADALHVFHRRHTDQPDVPPRASSRVRRYKGYLENARSDLQSAQFRMRTTPTHVRQPRIITHSYPVFDVTLTAEVEASVRMLDTATGQVLMAETAGGRAHASDRYIEGDAYRNVPHDPLSLPDNETLISRAAYHATSDLERAVTRAVKLHGQRFALLAAEAQAAGDDDQAVENAVYYLFAYPAGGRESSRMLGIASQALADEADIIPLAYLFQSRCGVTAR